MRVGEGRARGRIARARSRWSRHQRPPGASSGSAAGAAAGVRVTPAHVPEMRRRLGLPVTIDETGWLRVGVELRFRRRADRTIQPLAVLVGSQATVDDVLGLGDVFARTTRYNNVLRGLRALRDQLRALVDHKTLDATTLAADRELLDLDEMIAHRQSRCMGYGAVRVHTLDLEIEFLSRRQACLADRAVQTENARVAFLDGADAMRPRTAMRQGRDT